MWLLLLLACLCSSVFGYSWANVKIGGGGGFIPGIVFNPTTKGVAYARADIGGVYRLNADDSWTPLLDFVNDSNWHDWGVLAVATDPVDPKRVYILVGLYTNSWDSVGSVLRSADSGATWQRTTLPFKVGGNQPGRGCGERLAVDPKNNKIIYLAASGGHGLFRSTDQGATFTAVASFPKSQGTFQETPSDSSGYGNDPQGLVSVVFDNTSTAVGGATSRIFVAAANINTSSVYVSNDAGSTWTTVAGQPTGYYPHRMKLSTAEKALYISYDNVAGPYDAGKGQVWRYALNGTWKNITPAWEAKNGLTFGYGGLALDAQNPGTLMVAADNLWAPDVNIFRSNDSGSTWTPLWDYVGGQTVLYYKEDTDKAPWITNSRPASDTKILGWMVESLEIDPFDCNHWLYGTGETMFGGHDLMKWPHVHVQSLADGIEEMAVLSLISTPGAATLLSGVGDNCGFRHTNLKVAPNISFTNPIFSSTADLDYAGLNPNKVVRVGNDGSAGLSQLAVSPDNGVTWSSMALKSNSTYGGVIAYSADGSSMVWDTASMGFFRFANGVQTSISLSSSAVVVADKVNPKYFYAADPNSAYVSKDGGATFQMSSSLSNGGPTRLRVHPKVAGDVWFSSTSGLFHSTNFGTTWTKIPGVTSAAQFALGKGNGTYPNIYGFMSINGGATALYRSVNQGTSWTQISDAAFGFASGGPVAASMDTAGLVFVGTNGRGIFYGLPNGTAITVSPLTPATDVPPSASSTAAAASSGTIAIYAQCGGIGWTGAGTCQSGLNCTEVNSYYYQCVS